jgi:hypothetical protein
LGCACRDMQPCILWAGMLKRVHYRMPHTS